MIQLIRGFKDILPPEISLWQEIETHARAVFDAYGYKEVRLPILEKTELFARSIGEGTDIVEKEMYTFPGSRGELLTMRPEATASVVRSYIQHKMAASDPVRKLFTIGPMFRRERPQKGRYRQFYQIDCEAFGSESPFVDAQMILMLADLLARLEVTDVTAHINSLGCPDCRPKYRETLLSYINEREEQLCEDCKRRKDKNPLRVLDCKAKSCREAMTDAPELMDHLCDGCADHFAVVTTTLDKHKMEYEIDKRLVRGLDYYTRTAFELQTSMLGAQSAVAGGGRYDGLVQALGGPEVPAIGFAIGFDRLAELIAQTRSLPESRPDVFIIPMGDVARAEAFDWCLGMARAGIQAETDYEGRSLKSLMKRANKLHARLVVIVGENELAQGRVPLKDMDEGGQREVAIDALVDEVKAVLGK